MIFYASEHIASKVPPEVVEHIVRDLSELPIECFLNYPEIFVTETFGSHCAAAEWFGRCGFVLDLEDDTYHVYRKLWYLSERSR